jgi:hypothetical protein
MISVFPLSFYVLNMLQINCQDIVVVGMEFVCMCGRVEIQEFNLKFLMTNSNHKNDNYWKGVTMLMISTGIRSNSARPISNVSLSHTIN